MPCTTAIPGGERTATKAERAPEAVQVGAEGIGLFRNEHLFYGKGAEQPLFLLRRMSASGSEAERRAALTADKIAKTAEFFSFGTNDLTQMTFGFSRDDIGGFVPDYLEKKVLPAEPFQILDREGAG
jgi:hypothetical protein